MCVCHEGVCMCVCVCVCVFVCDEGVCVCVYHEGVCVFVCDEGVCMCMMRVCGELSGVACVVKVDVPVFNLFC